MGLGEYLVGLLVLLGTWGAALASAWIVADRRLPRLAGAPRAVAVALLALAALVLEHLLPGMLGVLSRWSALAAGVALAAAVWRLVPRAPGAARDDAPEPVAGSGPLSWALAALGVAAALACALAQARSAIRVASQDIDSLTFHLPAIGRWMQSGSLWQFDQFVPLQAHGAYPHNGNLVTLAVVEPLRSDAFVRLVGPLFVAVAALAVYAIARELRAPRAPAVLCAALSASLPIVAGPAWAGAATDPVALAAFAGGVLFALRHLRLGRTADLVLAGVGLGLAFGTKWYAVSSVAVVVAAWAVAMLAARRGPAAVLRGGAMLVALIALCGGFWFVRNAVETPSPLFPLSLPPLWEAPHDLVRACLGFTVADYASDGRIVADYLYPAWRATLGLAGAVLGVALLAAAVAALRARDRAVLFIAATSAALTVVYAFTPYTALGTAGEPIGAVANTRYLGPALLCAAPLAAWLVGRLPRIARAAAELVLLVALGDALRRAYDLAATDLALAAAALLAAAAAGRRWGHMGRGQVARRGGRGQVAQRRGARRRAALPVALAVGALAVALVGFERLRAFESDRYTTGDPVVRELVERAGAGSRVGIAGVPHVVGTAPVWPAFGTRIDNRVEFVGRMVDGQLREYDDPASWRAAVARGRYDLVVVGRGGYPSGCPFPGRDSDDDAFARAAGLRRLAGDHRLTLYEVPRGIIGSP